MVTVYLIPCSCGCGAVVQRKVFKTGACKVRAYRDKESQIVQVDGGEVVQDLAVAKKVQEKSLPVESSKKIEPSVGSYGKCGYCRKADAIGVFRMRSFDDAGEHEKSMPLCGIHYNRAKQEGVIIGEEE